MSMDRRLFLQAAPAAAIAAFAGAAAAAPLVVIGSPNRLRVSGGEGGGGDPDPEPGGENTPISSPFTLEIMDFKGAGNGSPAMPSSHPNFRAYTGLEYRRRVAVRGGSYPYRFALSNQPTGMTIDPDTGVITWPNPAAGTHSSIQLTVTDAIDDTDTATFSVAVGTSGFYFLDASYDGTSTGSISQPFKTLNAAVVGMQGNPTAILYIRQGTYTVSSYSYDGTYDGLDGPGNDGASGAATDGGCLYVNVGATTAGENWIAYPGDESPVIDLEGEKFIRTVKPYWQGLTIKDGREYSLKFSSAANYWKFLDCEFDGVVGASSSNRNQGFTFAVNDGNGYYGSFQGCALHDFTGAQAVGSLYLTNKVLIEDCHVYDGGWSGRHTFATHVGLKQDCDAATIRGCFFQIPSGAVGRVELYNYPGGDSLDFCYNRVIAASDVNAIILIEEDWHGAKFYRNNIKGRIDGDNGTHTDSAFTYNVIAGTFVDASGLSQSDNIIVPFATDVFDSSGFLKGEYTQYIGTHGADLP